MFYPPVQASLIKPEGRPGSRIALVGGFTNGYDANARRPFSGPPGTILEQCLHNAGIIRGECYLTNVIKERTLRPKELADEERGTFTDRGMAHLDFLRDELREISPNIIVTFGQLAASAICNLPNLLRYRGYIFESSLLPGTKVLPTLSPMDAMRGMYIYRYLIATDLKKASSESKFPELRRPDRKLVYRHDSVSDALEWLDFYAEEPIVGFDIEVLNYEVACISFSSTPDLACVIPIADRWTIDEECLIWRGIQRVLGNPKSVKVVQNGMFDIPFLLTHNGVVTRGEIHDTMVGHHIVYPDLQKGLGFLGSVYCGSQAYWKDAVKFTSIKQDD